MITQPTFALVTETLDGYTKETLFDTVEASLAYANYEWSRMSEREHRNYITFSIMKGYLDECGCFNTRLGEISRRYNE